MAISRVKIVGSGLIGTSIGLALAAKGISVQMRDRDPKAEALAQDLIGAHSGASAEEEIFDLVILAVPISSFSAALSSEIESNLNSVFIDVSSVKSKVKVEVLAFDALKGRFIGTHPMAGREVGGAESARADLFEGRVWAIDSDGATPQALERVSELIALTGATLVEISSEAHDSAVALISHLPQLVSSLLAKQLKGADPQWLELAGAGLRDTTRIAGSSPELWREIITANSTALKPLLINLKDDVDRLIAGIDDHDAIDSLIRDGQAGRRGIPGKHGGSSRDYTYLPIVIDDKPGQLAALFEECASAGVNVEDLAIEHSPGQFTGLITLSLSADDANSLSLHLQKVGWKVHPPR
jgi:prephenate dehydrogenase